MLNSIIGVVDDKAIQRPERVGRRREAGTHDHTPDIHFSV